MPMRDLIPWRKRRGRPESIDRPARDDVQEFFREALEDFFSTGAELAPLLRRGLDLGPAVDVSETDKEYKAEVEMPGVKKEDLNVTIDDGRLHIEGRREEEDREEGKNYLRVERSSGSFSRTLELPPTVDEERAEADFKDGVLTVRLPKTAESRGKKVEVKSESED